MADKSELEQTHCVVSKVFAFTVPPLGSADGFKASLWPKQPIWVGRLRVVSRGSKCAVLLEHTDKDGLFASCPIQDSRTVEPAVDSSRYFVLRLSDGKGRHALIGIGFNDRAQAFDFKVSLQDYENQNREGGALVESGSKHDYSIPEGGSIHVNIGSSGEKKKKKSISSSGAMDVSTAMAGLKLEGEKEKKKKKKKDKETREGEPSFAPSATASSIVGSSSAQSSNIIDFGFNDFDPLSSGAKPAAASSAFPQQQRSQASMDPFAPDAAPSFGTNSTPFDTPFDDTPNDWVKF